MYVGSNGVQALQEMASSGDLTVRFRAALALTPEDDLASWIAAAKAERAKHQHGMFKTPAVKIFADGVIEGHTAYLNEPYADALAYKGDATYRGEPIWQLEQMKKTYAELDKAGFQIHTHAIGDAATSETLDALAYAQKANRKHDWRPAITHIQLVATKDFKRFAKLGVTAVPDPYWFIKDDYYTDLQVPYLGQPRADLEYPMKSFFDAGVTVASASDYPVTIPPDPLAGIAIGVNRWDPDLRLRVPGAAEPQGRPLAQGARDRQADDPQLHDRGRQGQLPREEDGQHQGGQARRPRGAEHQPPQGGRPHQALQGPRAVHDGERRGPVRQALT